MDSLFHILSYLGSLITVAVVTGLAGLITRRFPVHSGCALGSVVAINSLAGLMECKNNSFAWISESSLLLIDKPKSLLFLEPAMYRYTWLILFTFCSTLQASSTSLQTIKQITSCSDHSLLVFSSDSETELFRSDPHDLRLIPLRALFWGVSSWFSSTRASSLGFPFPQFWQMQFWLQSSPALAQTQVARSLLRQETSIWPWTVRLRIHLRNPHLQDMPESTVGLLSQLKHWHAMHGVLANAHGHLLFSPQKFLEEGSSDLYLWDRPHLHFVFGRVSAVISV